MKYNTDLETLSSECELEFFRSSGPGGQNVNRRETAVRLRHLPSGIVIEAQEERSQWRNREIAFERLVAQLEKINNPPKPRKKVRIRRDEKTRLEKKHQRSVLKESRRSPDID